MRVSRTKQSYTFATCLVDEEIEIKKFLLLLLLHKRENLAALLLFGLAHNILSLSLFFLYSDFFFSVFLSLLSISIIIIYTLLFTNYYVIESASTHTHTVALSFIRITYFFYRLKSLAVFFF